MCEKTAKKTATESKDRVDERPCRGRMTRRKFVWASIFGFFAVWLVAMVRFFFPRVLFEPKTRIRLGYPSDYGMGVDTRHRPTDRIWVVRDAGKLFVILAKCPHLGCTPDWKERENKFKCPCHGSGFDMEGYVFEGPSPRAMDRVHVELDATGRIVIDKSRLYRVEDWKKPGAFLTA